MSINRTNYAKNTQSNSAIKIIEDDQLLAAGLPFSTDREAHHNQNSQMRKTLKNLLLKRNKVRLRSQKAFKDYCLNSMDSTINQLQNNTASSHSTSIMADFKDIKNELYKPKEEKLRTTSAYQLMLLRKKLSKKRV